MQTDRDMAVYFTHNYLTSYLWTGRKTDEKTPRPSLQHNIVNCHHCTNLSPLHPVQCGAPSAVSVNVCNRLKTNHSRQGITNSLHCQS